MPKRFSAPSTPSVMSAIEDYKPPDASALAARLIEGMPAPLHAVVFNSRESTPFVMEIPPGVDNWRSDAQAARRTLEEAYGIPATTRIRQLIPYTHYWQTEANHFAHYWRLVAGKLSEVDDIRDLIDDRHYWETEAMQYKRYVPRRKRAAVRQREQPGMKPSSRQHGNRQTDPRLSSAAITRRDDPVSSRTRSNGRVKKKATKVKRTGSGKQRVTERKQHKILKISSMKDCAVEQL